MSLAVIIPSFNRRALVCEAIDSVLDQTVLPEELIVVDDGSTDGTAEELRTRYAPYLMPGIGRGCEAPRPRIRLIECAHRGMPGAARNRGVAAASTELVAFLDSDDLYRPEKIERSRVELITAAPAGRRLLHTRELWLRDGREVSQKDQKHLRHGDVFEDALRKCIIGPSTVVMDRALFLEVGGFREDLEIAEDYELWLRVLALVDALYLDEPLTVKRAGTHAQLSEKYGQIEVFRIQALRDLVEARLESANAETAGVPSGAKVGDTPVKRSWPVSPERLRLACRELARKCGVYARGARKRGKTAEAADFEALSNRYVDLAERPGLQ